MRAVIGPRSGRSLGDLRRGAEHTALGELLESRPAAVVGRQEIVGAHLDDAGRER